MQNAAQKANEAAQKMQNQANEQARQNNMSMDQFESDSSSSESSSEGGEQKDGSKASKDAKPPKNSGKEKPGKRNKVQYINPEDEGDDEDWFKMKSESGTGAEIDTLDDVPAEYRGLVREYFKALNEGARK